MDRRRPGLRRVSRQAESHRCLHQLPRKGPQGNSEDAEPMAQQMTTPVVPTTPASHRLDDYIPIIGEPEVRVLRILARELKGRRLKMVNSTAVGGGVAEILSQLVPLLEDVGVPTKWDVIRGGEEFFAITKA